VLPALPSSMRLSGGDSVRRWRPALSLRASRCRSVRCPASSTDAPADALRHAHAVEMAREGLPLIVIQRQLGHSNLGIASVYLQGIDNAESSKRSTPAAPR
jgi:integrase